jgi:hypothetical protein
VNLVGKTQAVVDAEDQAAQDAIDLADAMKGAQDLNLAALRPLIAISSGSGTKDDDDKIKEIAQKLDVVREKIKKIKGAFA